MRTLTLRIYLTVVAVLALFALASGWLFQRQIEQERLRAESMFSERLAAWGDLIQHSLPGVDAPPDEQASALRDWSQRLRLPLALDSPQGARVGASESFMLRQAEGVGREYAIHLEDGRTLRLMRPGHPRPDGEPRGRPPGEAFRTLPFVPPTWRRGIGLVVVLAVLFVAVSAGAWPVVRRLTRRLQALKLGMETFGSGRLDHRVEVAGRDELAAVAASFNAAAARIEALVRSHQSLLANASHELRSPLARMKMALAMDVAEASPEQRARLRREIDTDIAELDALVEEVLLASRLDARRELEQPECVDLVGLAAEEAARVDASLEPPPPNEAATLLGDERLLRRALRNLLENAKRYGGDDVSVQITTQAQGLRGARSVLLRVCDRGPGVPPELRERIFEPFYRLPGHAETAGGVGLGLSLVKQIAQRHRGSVRCAAREGGGSCFVLTLPMDVPKAPGPMPPPMPS